METGHGTEGRQDQVKDRLVAVKASKLSVIVHGHGNEKAKIPGPGRESTCSGIVAGAVQDIIQPDHLRTYLSTRIGVWGGKGLVHQEGLWRLSGGVSQSNTLTLAARKLAGCGTV